MIMNEFVLKADPIIRLAQNTLMMLGSFTLLGIIIFLIYSHKNINVFINQNNRLIDKFPLVTPDFLNKPLKEQTIENNQEIHELNKKLDKIQYQIGQLNIHQSMTLEEVKRNDRAV